MGRERRVHTRHKVKVEVNCRHGGTYLFAHSVNVSELGIFIAAKDPLEVGSELDLSFEAPESGETIEISGEVVWVENGVEGRSRGMGIQFKDPAPQIQKRIKDMIRTIAYLG